MPLAETARELEARIITDSLAGPGQYSNFQILPSQRNTDYAV